jgi:SAM-dependent methyltransferase
MNSDEDNDFDSNPLNSFWMEGDSLAPPCQAEYDVVNAIIHLASPYLNSEAYLIDLGCGDGRICIAATKFCGCYSIGCEIETVLVEKFTSKVIKEGLEKKIQIIHDDLRNIDFSIAQVIVLYLLPESVLEITKSLIEAIKNGSVVICNTWGIKSLKPTKKLCCGFTNNVNLFLYDK